MRMSLNEEMARLEVCIAQPDLFPCPSHSDGINAMAKKPADKY
jgi:hypothetical protein